MRWFAACVLLALGSIGQADTKSSQDVSEEFLVQRNILIQYEKLFGDGVLVALGDFVNQNKGQFALSRCLLDVIHWAGSLKKIWALKMLDANGKFPAGIISGNFYSLGQYDECLSITKNDTGKNYKGKYCPAHIILTNIALTALDLGDALFPNSTISQILPLVETLLGIVGDQNYILGLCLPSTCQMDEITGLINWILRINNVNISRPLLNVKEKMCSTTDPIAYTTITIIAIVVFTIMFLLVILSTLYEIMIRYYYKEYRADRATLFLTSFSVITNTERILENNKSSSRIKCLHGIRLMSIFWMVLCHRFVVSARYPMQNVVELIPEVSKYYPYIILSGSVSGDSFLFLSGLLLAYVFLNRHKNKTTTDFVFFYLNRALRIWPSMAAIVLFVLGIYKYVGDGPLWYREHSKEEICEETWWTSLLFVQNYANPTKMCVPHLWFLAVDMQLYILSPIILFPFLKKKFKIGLANVIFWTLASQAAAIVIVYTHNWRGIMEFPSFWSEFYHATHARASVWFIGFLAGYLIFWTSGKKITMNRFLVLVIWLACFVALWFIVFGTKNFLTISHKVNQLEDSTYIVFSKLAWALILTWIVFCCVHGYGGPVNWFLSLRLWEIMSRLTYSIYLINIYLISIGSATSRTTFNFGIVKIAYVYFGDLIFVIWLSLPWTLIFESPFISLEKALFFKRNVKLEKRERLEKNHTKNET